MCKCLVLRYSQVCGRVRGYQVGTTNVFGPYRNQNTPSMVTDGMLIFHGKVQKHIWAAYVAWLPANKSF